MKKSSHKRTIPKICHECGRDFLVEKYKEHRPKLFCSMVCHNADLGRNKIGRKLSESTKNKVSLSHRARPKRGITMVERKCERCNKQIFVRLSYVKRGDGRFCTKSCAFKGRKFSSKHLEKISGSNANNWQGGKTAVAQIIRHRKEMRAWRHAVFSRDNWTCQDCKVRGGTLQAHHIKPFSLFPELRFAIDNGITLCQKCHAKTDSYGSKINRLNIKLNYVNRI